MSEDRNPDTRKITPSGQVTTPASGQSGLVSPAGLAVDGSGNVYVAESLEHVIRRITPAGVVTLFAGKAGVAGWADSVDPRAPRFDQPNGLASNGIYLYVADTNNSAIRLGRPTGAFRRGWHQPLHQRRCPHIAA